jgi:hypothetical protein
MVPYGRNWQWPVYVDTGLWLLDLALVRSRLLISCRFSPHPVRRLVFPQPDVNRVSQEVVGRPSQIGDLSDKLRLDPVDAGEQEVT